jgi:uncharacterized damage-inducible protein DinB
VSAERGENHPGNPLAWHGRTGLTASMLAPDIERPHAPLNSGEREMLEGWLDFHRATLLQKCAGLAEDQLNLAACPPSNLTLLGLVRHMAEVERIWFRYRFAGEQVDPLHYREDRPDSDFEDVDVADGDFAAYTEEVKRARGAVAGRSLDETFHHPREDPDARTSLRWVCLHMIEEYARHNGHADLLRERIDGATGQ